MAEPTTITMRVALVASEVVQSANASATMAIPRIICQRFICGLGLISDGFWNVRGGRCLEGYGNRLGGGLWVSIWSDFEEI